MYVRVDLHPSMLLRTAQAVSHSLALAVLYWVDLAVGLRVILALLVVTSFLRSIKSDFLQPRAILFIDGAPRLLFKGRVLEVALQEYVYCTSLLMVLHCKWRQLPRLPSEDPEVHRSRWRRRWMFESSELCILILPDSSSVDDRRRLRTLLRWHALNVQGQVGELRNKPDGP